MTPASKTKAAANTKIGTLIKLARRKDGATLDQLAKATGWQPHSVRAALTELRKKGCVILREKRDGTSTYTITELNS